MALVMYEMRYVRRRLTAADPVEALEENVRYPLDLTDVEGSRDLLNRLLYSAAERAGLEREQAHLVAMEVRGIDRFGQADEKVAFRWSLPVLPDDEVRRR